MGQPKGVAYLAFTELWERFSYYGMSALVVLYMVQQLLLPGHVENVAGMAGFRGVLEGLFGPLSAQALASQIFGLYSGLVYFTPVVGGLIADRLLGAKRTVLLGCALMCAGHFAMAFEQSFLIALLLLILGSGCLKGNIAAQVGHLYAPGEESRRTRGYALFSTGINIGAVLGPIACGALAAVFGWDAGFGAAGVLMLIASGVYLAGQRHIVDRHPELHEASPPPLTGADRGRIATLIAVLALTVPLSFVYYQFFNVGLVWLADHVDVSTPLGDVPIPWFNSIDAFASVAIAAPLIAFWRGLERRGREPGELGKIAWGALIYAGSCALMALAAANAGAGKTGVLLPFVAYCGIGIAFIWYWPTLLATVSRAAPPSVNALMVSSAYVSLFVSNVLMGWYGSRYEALGAVPFWAINATIAALGGLAIALLAPFLNRVLGARGKDEERTPVG